jgi:RimJ/RimL family protein N-acetyltransferase
MEGLVLRDVMDSDLLIFFRQQLDPDATRMAAFNPRDPSDKVAFDTLWLKIRTDSKFNFRTILVYDNIAGYVASLITEDFGKREVAYWIGKEYWGKGFATEALAQFLKIEKTRPIYAHVAKDNLGSRRVLEKCHFKIIASELSFANARGEEIEELILKLE